MFEAVVRVYRTSQIPVPGATVAAALYEAKRIVPALATPDGFAHELVGVLDRLSNTMHPTGVQFPPPGHYDVHWAVRIAARSALDGACQARCMQFDPRSLGSVYRVWDSNGKREVIDLQSAVNPH